MNRSTAALSLGTLVALAPAISHAEEPRVSFGAGLAGAASLSGFEEPGQVTLPDSGDTASLPAFSGLGASAGVAFEVRFLGVLGLSVEGLYTSESQSTDAKRDGRTVELSVSQPTFRVPILLRGTWPLGAWSPYVAAGPELVFFGLSSVEAEPGGRLRAVASASRFVGVLAGAGVEWKAPLGGVDLRIPIGLRFGFAPSKPEAPRVVALPSDALVLESTPGHRVELISGAAVWF